MTHALFAGSPAIDAGDPNFDPADPDGDPMTDDAVPYDQRGTPFDRVFDGNSNGVARIDIGAFELQPKGILGDYNRNGTVDAADYVVWRKTLGTTGVAAVYRRRRRRRRDDRSRTITACGGHILDRRCRRREVGRVKRRASKFKN